MDRDTLTPSAVPVTSRIAAAQYGSDTRAGKDFSLLPFVINALVPVKQHAKGTLSRQFCVVAAQLVFFFKLDQRIKAIFIRCYG